MCFFVFEKLILGYKSLLNYQRRYLRTLDSVGHYFRFHSSIEFNDAHAMQTPFVNHYNDVTVGISITYNIFSSEIREKNHIKIIDLIL